MSKQRKRLVIITTFLIVIAPLNFLWIAAGSLVSPQRREIQEYHRFFLDSPQANGITIDRATFLNGTVPTLIARRDTNRRPTEKGTTLLGQLAERGFAEISTEEKGIIVLLHGRMGRKEDMLPIAARYCAAGFICLLPDLPAHGESSAQHVHYGTSQEERHLPSGILKEAKHRFSLPDLPAHLWGMSMGGSFAIHAAAATPDTWSSLTLLCTFDEMNHLIEKSIGRFSGIGKRMVKFRTGLDVDAIRPIDLAPSISLPTLIAHGDKDQLISIDRGKALHAAFPNAAPFMTVPGANHNTILVTDAPVYATTAAHMLSHS